jgi:hypothetical protein
MASAIVSSSPRGSLAPSTEPDDEVPKAPDPNLDAAGYLRSIHSVRERCTLVFEKAKKNDLNHFDVDWDKMDQTVKWVEGIIKVSVAFLAKIVRIGLWL